MDDLKSQAQKFLESQSKTSSFSVTIDSFAGGEDFEKYSVSGKLNANNALLGGGSKKSYTKTNSSLQITVTKQTYKNGKWKGKLIGFGSYTYKNKGFITFNQAATSDTEKKLILTGGAYFLEKQPKENPSQGKIRYYKEVKKENGKALDKDNFNQYFPKPYWYTKLGGFDKYWYSNGGFIGGAKDLAKICGTDECDGAQQFYSFHTLKGKGSGGDWYDSKCDYGPHTNGCDNVYSGSGDSKSVSKIQGFDYMYGETGSGTRLEDHLDHVYKGAGQPVK